MLATVLGVVAIGSGVGIGVAVGEFVLVGKWFCGYAICARVRGDPRAGGSWSRPVAIDERGDLIAVSCTSATFCFALDKTANI